MQKEIQMIRVIKKYYIQNLTQDEIAKDEGISKSTVSRLLKRAEEKGYVKHSINLPEFSAVELENKIKELCNLKHVHVTPVHINNSSLIMHDVTSSLSTFINSIVKSNDVIGVSWGKTMSLLSKNLVSTKATNITDTSIVLLNGGVSKNTKFTGVETIIDNFSTHFNGCSYVLPVPSIVDSSEIADIIMKDSMIEKTFSLINRSNIAIFSIGSLSSNSILIESGYFSEEDYKNMKADGYVGDICCRYFKKDGSYDDYLYGRAIGISLEELKNKDYSIAIAIGEEKALSTLGAINGKYINSLFIDECLAKKLIEYLTFYQK